MTRTEELITVLSADVKDLKKGLSIGADGVSTFEKKVKSSSSSTIKQFEAIGKSALKIGAGVGAAATALGVAAKAALNAADHIGETAKSANLSAEEYQRYAHAVNLAGISTEEFDAAAIKLNVNLGKAAAGQKKQVEALNALGVTTTDTGDAIGQIADGLARIEDPAERARLATVVFGEAGARMVDVLGQGKVALDAAGASLDTLFSEEQIRAADEVNDRLDYMAKTTGTRLQMALLDAVGAAQSFLETMGLIDAQSLDGIQERVKKLQDELKPLKNDLNDKWTSPALKERRRGEIAAVEAEISKLKGRETAILEREAMRNLTPEARARIPNAQGGSGSRSYGPELPIGFSKPLFKSTESVKKGEKDAAAAAKALAEEEQMRREMRAKNVRAAAEQADVVAEMERERLEANSEKMKEFGASVSASLADMAVQGGSAADELKRRVVMALIQASAQALAGAAGGGGVNWGKIGLGALGAVVGSVDFGGAAASNGAAYSDFLANSGNGIGFATGGSFEVGGSGGTDSKRISFNATPGELVEVRRPGGTAGAMGGQQKVEQNVNIEVVPPAGMTATQERRRDANGRETVRLVVRDAIQREAATRTGGANALLDDSGARRAPRPGIS